MATTKKDYYETLGVSRDAGDGDLKKAFRRQALKYHPDKNPDDKSAEGRFKEINEAYAVLSNSEKRRAYDTFGHAGVGAGTQGFGGGGFDFGSGGVNDVFGDIFEDFFGGGGTTRTRRRATRGTDLRYDLEIPFEEAFFGKQIKIRIPRWEACMDCRGTGAKEGRLKACSPCGGTGQLRYQQGFFSVSRTCAHCHGEGKTATQICPKCQGERRTQKEQTLSVKIPAGIENGSRLRLSGEGEPGSNSGPSGDLYVVVSVRDHSLFSRQDNNLLCEIPISFTRAALGTSIEVPTMNGKTNLKIPPGTQYGKVFRIKGKGAPDPRGHQTGDLLVKVKVTVPTKLNQRQKELLSEFSEIMKKDSPSEEENFFKKFKNLF